VLVLALQVLAFSSLPHDDAYIAFRYAENLSRGRGLVFNPGEHVLGFTSPLHVLLAAGLHALVGHAWLPPVMAGLGCVGWWVQAACVFRLLQPALGARASLALAALLAVGGANSQQWVALETNLAVALALAALLAARGGAWLAAAAIVGVACLMRPDASIMAGLLGLLGWSELGKGVRRPLLVFWGVTLPWVLFATWYFGSPVPEPLRVKFQRTALLDYGEHAASELTRTLLGVDTAEPWLIAIATGLAIGGSVKLLRLERRLWPLVAYGALHLTAYLFLRPFRAHVWHLYPSILVFALCAWTLLATTFVSAPRAVARFSAALALLVLLGVYASRTLNFARDLPTGHWFGSRDATYRAAAAYLRSNARAGDRVAAVEVGTLAYYSDLPMRDLGGLVTRDSAIVARPPRPYAWLVADSHYPWLGFPGVAPVKEWSGGFPLRLYLQR